MSVGVKASGRVGALLLCAFLGACTDLRMDPAINRIPAVIDSPSFRNDLMPVLRATCASSDACHGGATPQLGLNLQVDSLAYATAVNQASVARSPMLRIRPGIADSSFLYRVLSTDSTFRLGYYRMPLTQYAVPNETRLTIRNWINQGALNN